MSHLWLSPVSVPRSGSTPPTFRPFTMLSPPTVAPSSPHRSTAPSVGPSPSPTPTATTSRSTTAPDRPNAPVISCPAHVLGPGCAARPTGREQADGPCAGRPAVTCGSITRNRSRRRHRQTPPPAVRPQTTRERETAPETEQGQRQLQPGRRSGPAQVRSVRAENPGTGRSRSRRRAGTPSRSTSSPFLRAAVMSHNRSRWRSDGLVRGPNRGCRPDHSVTGRHSVSRSMTSCQARCACRGW